MTRGAALLYLMTACTVTALVTIDATWYYMEKKVYPARLASEKFKTLEPEHTVCRVYINQDGMIDVSSPDGTVEMYTTENNVVVEDSGAEGE